MRLTRETPRARFDTFTGGVDNPEFLTIIFKVMRPPSEAGRDLQDRSSWQATSNTRQDGAGPLRGGTAPRLGPFLACILPTVLRFLRMARHTCKNAMQLLLHRSGVSRLWGPTTLSQRPLPLPRGSVTMAPLPFALLAYRYGFSPTNFRKSTRKFNFLLSLGSFCSARGTRAS